MATEEQIDAIAHEVAGRLYLLVHRLEREWTGRSQRKRDHEKLLEEWSIDIDGSCCPDIDRAEPDGAGIELWRGGPRISLN